MPPSDSQIDLEIVELMGVKFTTSPYHDIKSALDEGAMMVVPSGPGLATIDDDQLYYQAIRDADFAIFDSSLFILLCRLLGVGAFPKYSGYAFLRDFLGDSSLSGKYLMLVDPNQEESKANSDYLESLGLGLNVYSYVAPVYGDCIEDSELKSLVIDMNPDFLLINIGGGVQEILGAWLKKVLVKTPGIICTGAAIAFLTGRQAHITDATDRLYLGWLVRSIHSPIKFTRRYLAATKLITVMRKRRDELIS